MGTSPKDGAVQRKGPKAIIRELLESIEEMGQNIEAAKGASKVPAMAARASKRLQAIREAKAYLDRKPAKRMEAKRPAGSAVEKALEARASYRVIAGQMIGFLDTDGETLFEVSLDRDRLQVRAPGNNPARGEGYLDSTLSLSWSASNVAFVDRQQRGLE